MRPVWREINLEAMSHNYKEIKRIVSSDTKIMAIVKADGYGHGAEVVSRIAVNNGASALGVATLKEAVFLREKGFALPILIMGYTPDRQLEGVLVHDITQTIFNLEQAEVISDAAADLSCNANIHLKIDTGMGRLGFPITEESISIIERIYSLANITVEGIFTHFSCADFDMEYTHGQLSKFLEFLDKLKARGIIIPIKHAANSAAIINNKESHLDMVRPGLALYGLYPSEEMKNGRIDLRPAMSLKTEVAQVKDFERGMRLSYGKTYITPDKRRIAALPLGYADGFRRSLSNKGYALINGQRAPLVGNICMDQCLIDVSEIQGEVVAGDEVVLLGSQGDDEVTADFMASQLGTINYEIVTGINKRVPRVFKK